MEKFTLSRQGVQQYTKYIYSFTDDKLRAEAMLFAKDFLAHIALRFELQVYQLEHLRSITRNFTDVLGWTFAAAMVCRRPLQFMLVLQDGPANDATTDCVMLGCGFTAHYESGVLNATGELRIQYCEG